MTALVNSPRLRVKAARKSLESGVTFEIPTVTRTASRPALNRGGRGQDTANELVASRWGELRRVPRVATKVVAS